MFSQFSHFPVETFQFNFLCFLLNCSAKINKILLHQSFLTIQVELLAQSFRQGWNFTLYCFNIHEKECQAPAMKKVHHHFLVKGITIDFDSNSIWIYCLFMKTVVMFANISKNIAQKKLNVGGLQIFEKLPVNGTLQGILKLICHRFSETWNGKITVKFILQERNWFWTYCLLSSRLERQVETLEYPKTYLINELMINHKT